MKTRLFDEGFDYSMNSHSKTKIFETLGVDALKDIPYNNEHKYLAKNFIKSEFMRSSSQYLEVRMNISINEKTKNHYNIFTRTDKRNTFIVIKETEHINKTSSKPLNSKH